MSNQTTLTPETDRRIIKQSPRMCGCHYESEIVFASLARRLERERDEALYELEKFREALDWISKQYDDSKPTHQVAMIAYEMSCTARYALQKDTIK